MILDRRPSQAKRRTGGGFLELRRGQVKQNLDATDTT